MNKKFHHILKDMICLEAVSKYKRKIERPCLQRPRGREKRKMIPPRRLLRRKIILQQKVISK